MSYVVTVKQKFQVTVPAALRKTVNLREGDTLEADVVDGKIVLALRQQAARAELQRHFGAAKGLYSSSTDIDQLIAEQRSEWQP